MAHCDPHDLALIALGEPAAGPDRQHLATCPVCRAEADELAEVVALGRQVTRQDFPEEPPQHVWSNIRTQLAMGEQPGSDTVVTLLRPRSQQRRGAWGGGWLAAAAMVVGIAVGAVGSTLVVRAPDAGPQQVVAQSRLTALPAATPGDPAGTAEAVVVNGLEYLEVDVTGLAQFDGYYEVWLIKPDLSGMVSLGALSGGSSGRFVIPPGIDVDVYSLVDISAEPLDGRPEHSKDSRVRGSLQT